MHSMMLIIMSVLAVARITFAFDNSHHVTFPSNSAVTPTNAIAPDSGGLKSEIAPAAIMDFVTTVTAYSVVATAFVVVTASPTAANPTVNVPDSVTTCLSSHSNTATPTHPMIDPTPVSSQDIFPDGANVTAAGACWSAPSCSNVFNVLEKCYTDVGPVTDPRDSKQSQDYQRCVCQDVLIKNPQIAGQPFDKICQSCMTGAGIPQLAIDIADVQLSDFCASQDPNMYLYLDSLMSFFRSAVPSAFESHPPRLPTSLSWTPPLTGPITQVTTLASKYTAATDPLPTDPLANLVWGAAVTGSGKNKGSSPVVSMFTWTSYGLANSANKETGVEVSWVSISTPTATTLTTASFVTKQETSSPSSSSSSSSEATDSSTMSSETSTGSATLTQSCWGPCIIPTTQEWNGVGRTKSNHVSLALLPLLFFLAQGLYALG
ncbi:hypothetical protein LTR50_005857 [Elasticomyces elasticus]|nr:hypothetical protein LTR50_005857 [Elasticomyces elasticus]